ncbi:MAG: hypothetical protein GWN00_17235, partial [Aliifodinibius sp.]|nr:hypothetical protein [Fodinibius sp.]NIV13767.1 hypothetical protein [Fodinibius sp.]NIY26483.1 hypothetical protein [Fodinibius sp.]
DTNGVLAFRQPGSPLITNLYSVDTDALGEADVIVNDLLPGIYDSTFKGLSHLKKLLPNQDVDPLGGSFLDFTF